MKCTSSRKPKLNLGTVVISSQAACSVSLKELGTALARHASGDWGALTEEEKRENDYDLLAGHTVRSIYRTGSGQPIWIVTVDNRSVTTVVHPDEL